MLKEKLRDLEISSVVIIFDRDFGKLVFRDFRGYGSLLDDAEWLLERTQQRSWGFMLRPVIQNGCYGLWIGEYMPNNNRVIREEIIFSKASSKISKLLMRYAEDKASERKIDRIMDISVLKKMLPESNIIRGFKYYICPEDWIYKRCPYAKEIYRAIEEKYGSSIKLYYSRVAEMMPSINKCDDVLICPLLASPNAFERILILNNILRSSKIGEIKVLDKNTIRIS
ncbi:MAG: hypothetical protein QXW39_08525 [Candidatus Bathyarchaeia archaeon]